MQNQLHQAVIEMPRYILIANEGETRGSSQAFKEKMGGTSLYERRSRARAIELFIRILAKERTKKKRYQVIAHEMVCLFVVEASVEFCN